MRSISGIFVLILFNLLILSCAEHVPSKNEQLYLDAADSLKRYQNVPYIQKEIASHETTSDLLKLDYEDFKEKHDWKNEEVEVFAEIIQGHVSIAKTLEAFNSRND